MKIANSQMGVSHSIVQSRQQQESALPVTAVGWRWQLANASRQSPRMPSTENQPPVMRNLGRERPRVSELLTRLAGNAKGRGWGSRRGKAEQGAEEREKPRPARSLLAALDDLVAAVARRALLA